MALAATPAGAHFYSGGGANPVFTIRPYSYNATWMPPLDRALTNWNATATPADITKNSGSASTLTVASYSGTWYGLYAPSGTRANRTFAIQINSRTITRDATNFANFVSSSTTHEFGHRLSLNDISDGTHCTTAIMSYCRNRNVMHQPQSHDISDVNEYY
ncbi:hypothetical protein [Nonomuraea typhae]|uniref:Peptidase M10 metallopeptidase domain-containing protein n=1 Tax=Nonomuraea typhae TaxID=2603600 RepID=A0ABW7YQ14_9ACTN